MPLDLFSLIVILCPQLTQLPPLCACVKIAPHPDLLLRVRRPASLLPSHAQPRGRSLSESSRPAGPGGRYADDADADFHRRRRDSRHERGRDDDDGHYGPPAAHHHRGSRRGRQDDDHDDYDSRKKSRGVDGGGGVVPRKKEWPPHFESSGASFIFDARSGMFYEPSSDFFYDPKTKLYYGNRQQEYFRYDADKKPYVFQPIGDAGAAPGIAVPDAATAAEESPADVSPPGHAVAAEAKQGAAEAKPKIAISLKTPLPPRDPGAKSLTDIAVMEKARLNQKNVHRQVSATSPPGENAAGTLPQAHKKHAKDMTKWSERGKEMRDDDVDAIKAQQPATATKATASGQPICVLCRRKFADPDKLQKHERLSALHRDNLAKKAAADAAVVDAARQKQESEASYRDRSKERRMMYGSHIAPDSSHAEALLAHSLGGSASSVAEVIRPEETLNDTNVGNRLLQKMGWNSGESLGRAGAQANSTDGSATKIDVASTLKSDWERIESMAQRGGRR